ncbi:lipopolysaccharide biosynthesis protein [Aquibium sp. ELW1220]|uniref:lipopolysaccharide biosynthesis protein n=1 Tax=Aquibium sp. ELW1220 TaxID=2976766 RepID=UPI0025B1ABEA|nr:lipopolysaccharide biosynthesis protein [Aquibium sp. ELW1220]MDN2580192.1 lipopolysaccharide biosynthesis protein [Aquibium sp. ELW1220]
MQRIIRFLATKSGLLRDYATAVSGSAGRLVFSLIYFVALANTLSIAEFGLFATASAAGVMLSRILAFGFISALYRAATVKPLLLGVFTGGFLAMALLSLPVLAAASYAVWLVFFGGEMALGVFALLIVAETLLWRPVEAIIIVNNGMGRFARAAFLAILTTALRALAALAFAFWATPDLASWAGFYLAANALSLAIAAAFFYPRRRIRFRIRLYLRRLADSVYVAGAEMIFYLQMEMDKLLVLAIGGPHLAGIYAIVMRLIDLTAIPIRTFTMMLVQRMMRTPEMLSRRMLRFGLEAGVFAVSTAGLLALALALRIEPTLLGKNVAEAAPLVLLALFVPGLRNLVEYQAELLFARGQTLLRAVNLALLAGLKALLLTTVLLHAGDTAPMVLALNGAFALLYLASAALTYSAMRMPPRPF